MIVIFSDEEYEWYKEFNRLLSLFGFVKISSSLSWLEDTIITYLIFV